MNAIQNYDLFTLQCQIFGLRAFNLSQKKKTQQNKSTSITYHQVKHSNINFRFVFALRLILSKHFREKTKFPSFHGT